MERTMWLRQQSVKSYHWKITGKEVTEPIKNVQIFDLEMNFICFLYDVIQRLG